MTATWIYHCKWLERVSGLPSGARIEVPIGIAAFPDPVFLPPPRSFAEKTYDVVHWTEMGLRGHFAAFEQPEAMLADLRPFVATVSRARS